MKIIIKKLLFIPAFSVIFFCASAQCDECIVPESYQSDYCFSDSLFIDYCAFFKENASFMVITSGKKQKELPLLDLDSIEFYIDIANDKKLKLKSIDILFIQLAYKSWNEVKKDINMEFEESGLGIKRISPGNGTYPKEGQTVKVHYVATLEDGTKFDSSIDRGTPLPFQLGVGKVIKGWDEGIQKISVGEKALLKIPPELGYGARGAGRAIPPNATLYFEVELVAIE